MTLACEDGRQVEAHRLVLAASSPFFENLLRRNKHPHPLVYMRGVKSDDLMAIVDFLYLGEANVNQENLDSFLAVADELQLKGLRSQDQHKSRTEDLPTTKNLNNFERETMSPTYSHFSEKEDGRSLALPNFLSGDLQELDSKVQSMMEKGSNMVSKGKDKNGKETFGTGFICKVCGKEGQKVNIRDHIEANHLEGIALPCNLCDKISRSRKSLRLHTSQAHV